MLEIKAIEALCAEVHLATCETVCNITIFANLSIPQAAILTLIACSGRLARNAIISTGRAGSLILEISIHASIADLSILGAGQAVGMRILTGNACESTEIEPVQAGALSIHWC